MARLRITETVTIISFVTVDKYCYPAANEDQGAMTPQEAKEYEEARDFVDTMENFSEMLTIADFGTGSPEEMDQHTTGSASRVVTIVE